MHFLMTALGSYGDVYPVVGLGQALRGRGHQVSIVTNPHFRSVVEATGLEFVRLGTEEDYDKLADSPDIWHPIRGPKRIMQLGIADQMRCLYETISQNVRKGESVLVASCLDLASRVYQEKNGGMLASVFLAPMPFRSSMLPPKMGPQMMDGRVPGWFRHMQFWVADRFVVDKIIGLELNGLRKELGLPAVKGIFRDWYYSPQLVLGLFPKWFAPPQSDWPPQTCVTGFPQWDEADPGGMSEEVSDFLMGGDPPIVFTPGSAMAHGEDFFRTAADVCRQLQCRGLFLTKYPQQIPSNLPEGVRHFPFVPFSQLLPRVAALVHHGGIGTCAQGLAAALPQLLMPMAFDQFDNAERLRRLGVAKSIRPKHFRSAKVVSTLEALLKDPATHESCLHWAKKCNPQMALEETCKLLEEFNQSRLST